MKNKPSTSQVEIIRLRQGEAKSVFLEARESYPQAKLNFGLDFAEWYDVLRVNTSLIDDAEYHEAKRWRRNRSHCASSPPETLETPQVGISRNDGDQNTSDKLKTPRLILLMSGTDQEK